jgi:hypothetical protein
MKASFVFAIVSGAVLALVSLPAAAQQKTAKECNAEWTAKKASIQASGKTKKAFMAECRGQATTTATPAAPAATRAPRGSRATTRTETAGVKTAKECNAEWTANKAAIQASKKTKKQFMAECRGQTAGATAAAPSAPAPSTATPSTPAPTRPPPSTRRAAAPPPARPTTASPSAAGQFSTEAQAKAKCPADTVVWVNTDSNIYHFAGGRNYGHTKSGAYMCERDANAAGARAAKNEKHP